MNHTVYSTNVKSVNSPIVSLDTYVAFCLINPLGWGELGQKLIDVVNLKGSESQGSWLEPLSTNRLPKNKDLSPLFDSLS